VTNIIGEGDLTHHLFWRRIGYYVKKIMKSAFVFLVLVLLIAIGCTDKDSSSMLKDDNMRKALYSEILSNHDYLKELLDSMKTNDHAQMMIYSDTAMFNKLMKNGSASEIMKHLTSRAEKDSVTCKQVCESLMDHKKVMVSMLETLDKKGVVKKGCMMMSKEKTSEKPDESKHHH
jgi:hypothetical protein